MSIRLNGRLMPGFDYEISNRLKIAGEEKSGQTSSTLEAEIGFKPMMIGVSFKILFQNRNEVQEVYRLATSTDGNDERVIYNIQNDLVNALKIRQVKFSGDVSVKEISGKKAWQVNLTLREHRSVQEKKEMLVSPEDVTQQVTDGEEIQTIEPPSQEIAETTTIEKILRFLDDSLA